MASGLVVVAYNEAAAHEHLVTDHNGMLVNAGDTPDFATTASQLCTQPEKIASMGKEAAEHAKSLDWNRIVARFVELLRKQIGE